MVVTPEYYENNLVKVNFSKFVSENFSSTEVEYSGGTHESVSSDFESEETPEGEFLVDSEKRLKAELTAKLIHGYDFVLESQGNLIFALQFHFIT